VWRGENVELLDHEIGAFSISIKCRLLDVQGNWIFSRVYGPTLFYEVADFLEELANVRARWDLTWCIRGDFNLIRFIYERKGENNIDHRMRMFGDFIERWKLVDGPLKRGKIYMV